MLAHNILIAPTLISSYYISQKRSLFDTDTNILHSLDLASPLRFYIHRPRLPHQTTSSGLAFFIRSLLLTVTVASWKLGIPQNCGCEQQLLWILLHHAHTSCTAAVFPNNIQLRHRFDTQEGFFHQMLVAIVTLLVELEHPEKHYEAWKVL